MPDHERRPPDLSHIPPLGVRLRQAIVPILAIVVLFVAIFMGLSMEMSSPFTREGPDCSFWCAAHRKVLEFLSLAG